MIFFMSDVERGKDEVNWPTVRFEMPNDSTLDEVLMAFEQFLRASGYEFPGLLVGDPNEDQYSSDKVAEREAVEEVTQ